MKKIISVLLTISIIFSCFFVFVVNSYAYEITYNTDGGSFISQTQSTQALYSFDVNFYYYILKYDYTFTFVYSKFNGQYYEWICNNLTMLTTSRNPSTSTAEYYLVESGKWMNDYKLSYNALTWSSRIENQVFHQYCTVTSEVPAKDGYVFLGWEDVNNNSYVAGQEIDSSSITLIAQWQQGTHLHQYTQKQVERTCTEQGYSEHTCACGESYMDKYVDAGHTWGEAEIIKEPTATTEGQRKYKCTKCSFEKIVAYNGITTLTDVVYGSDPVRQSVNIQLPKDASGDCGLYFTIHGGAWKIGDKSELLQADIARAEETGLAVASLNYRYISDYVCLDDVLDDITNALKKVKEVAKQYGLNINKVMLSGGSAGGHLSLLYAYKMQNVSPIEIACTYAYAGPSDLSNSLYYYSALGRDNFEETMSQMMRQNFTFSNYAYFVDSLKKISGQYYVNENSVPTGLVHGQLDDAVPVSDSENLKALLDSYGIPNSLIVLPHCAHALNDSRDTELAVLAFETEDSFLYKYLYDYVPEANHNYVKSQIVAPTCIEQGYTLYSCTKCDKTYKQDFTLTVSHSLGEWETATPATYTEKGLEVQKCSVCKQIINTRDIEILDSPEVSSNNEKISIDKALNLIIVNEQGLENFDEYLNLTNCTVEYSQTLQGFGTGSKVKVKNVFGEEVGSFDVVIVGDITGDGYVDAFDISSANEYINNFDEPSEKAFKKSIDILEDDFLDATDLAYIISMANFE